MIVADLKATAVKYLVGLVLLCIVGMTCSGWAAHRVQAAYDHATKVADHDSSAAHGRRDKQVAMREHASRLAERQRADSLAKVARRSDSLAVLAKAALKPVADSTDVVELRQDIRDRDAVIDAQSVALNDARIVPTAYIATLSHADVEAAAAMASANEYAHADTQSQTLGRDDAKSAHWRGIKQGVVGTVVTSAVLIVTGVLLHLGGKL